MLRRGQQRRAKRGQSGARARRPQGVAMGLCGLPGLSVLDTNQSGRASPWLATLAQGWSGQEPHGEQGWKVQGCDRAPRSKLPTSTASVLPAWFRPESWRPMQCFRSARSDSVALLRVWLVMEICNVSAYVVRPEWSSYPGVHERSFGGSIIPHTGLVIVFESSA